MPALPQEEGWKSAVSPIERYENVQKIQKAIDGRTLGGSAIALENEAFRSSTSREDYESACAVLAKPGENDSVVHISPHADAPEGEGEGEDEDSGTRIGAYRQCHYIASGVTADVYRCKDRALKVIVETRDIEPHNHLREAKILALLRRPCIPLLETFRDQEQRFVLVFPYMPLTLAAVLDQGAPLPRARVRRYFADLFAALAQLHAQGMIHRDVKPSALLLESPEGPAYLSDFGTTWHPRLSAQAEPADAKILDIGTGPYRAPEALFGDRAYGPAVDMWGAGAMLAESCRDPPRPLFESRPVHEDGNQLGLILSIFKTLGTPTAETWPEAASYRTPPFEMYRVFEPRPWEEILPDVAPDFRALVARLVRYDSKRATAAEALQDKCMIEDAE